MRRTLLAAFALAVILLGAAATAQQPVQEFSGRWRLVDVSPADGIDPDTLVIAAPDELLIVQTPIAITIEHPSKLGSHPAAGTFTFGYGGSVSGVPKSTHGADTQWGVSFIGSQLLISQTTEQDANAGARLTRSRGSMWGLDRGGRLLIEFTERLSGTRPRTATRIYVRRK